MSLEVKDSLKQSLGIYDLYFNQLTFPRFVANLQKVASRKPAFHIFIGSLMKLPLIILLVPS